MTKRVRLRNGLFSPARAGPALAFVIAAQLAPAPAAAQSRGSLTVTATVLPSCIVTTKDDTASSSCSNFGDGSVKIERASRGTASASDSGGPSPSAMRANDVNFVTITY